MNCIFCHKSFNSKSPKAKFCSSLCRTKNYQKLNYELVRLRDRVQSKENYHPIQPHLLKCKICGKSFFSKFVSAKWCSKSCEHNNYYARHKKERVAYNSLWNKTHIESIHISNKKWHTSNPEKVKLLFKNWCKNNPEKYKHHNALNSYRRRGALGSHTYTEWSELKIKYNFTCPHCGRKEPEIQLTRDHIIPIIKGGTNYISNIQPLCRSCNCSKGSQLNFQ
jgi:5-methylcytosine-specific restriction endonuclease McrA